MAVRLRRGLGAMTEQFWTNVDTRSGECWPWMGVLDVAGYGVYCRRPAHRLIYEAVVEPIPEGFQIDHLCRTPRCVRPSHLEAVTPRVNVLRSTNPAAINAAKTMCKNGHPLTEANTRRARSDRSSGFRRVCRLCEAIAQRKYREKKKGGAS